MLDLTGFRVSLLFWEEVSLELVSHTVRMRVLLLSVCVHEVNVVVNMHLFINGVAY